MGKPATRRAIVLLLLSGAYCHMDAALLSVSATTSAGTNDFSLHSDSESVSAEFRVVVTGGTGIGVFTPDITLQGTTNESDGTFLILGGVASASWPQMIQVGDPIGPAIADPMFSCGFNPQCNVSFTFGVPLTFRLTLDASASISENPGQPPTLGTTVGSTAEFDGLVDFRDSNGNPVDAQFTITELPETDSLPIVGLGIILLVIYGIWRRPRHL